MIGDPAQDVCEPGLRIDVIQLSRHDQRAHHGRALTTAIGTGEEPRLATERDAAQLPLGGIVSEADLPVVEEAREGGPSLEHVIHRLGDIGMSGEPCTLGTHPAF